MPLDKSTIKQLPRSSGVYLLKDGRGKIIYVGKANSLRDRLKSYVDPGKELNPRRRRLVEAAVSLEYVLTDSEAEALVLENVLIKKHRTRYNVLFRDDKTYPYIKLAVGERYPRLLKTRRVAKDGALYFGPYVSGWAVNRVLRFISRRFGVGKCGGDSIRPGKPCFNYHLDRCAGACGGMVERDRYLELVEGVKSFLRGDYAEVIADVERDMWAAAEQEDFERAAVLRNLLSAVGKLAQEQKIQRFNARDGDVIGLAAAGDRACVQVFQVRNGIITGRRGFYGMLPVEDDTPATLLRAFILQYYEGSTEIPRFLFLPVKPADYCELEIWLRDLRGTKVTFTVSRRGDAHRLVELAVRNARELLRIKSGSKEIPGSERGHRERWDSFLQRYGLVWPPDLVECYDVSNLQGRQTVASRVVFRDGLPARDLYRRYRVRRSGRPDDVGSLREVLSRRVSHLVDGSEGEPDLVVVDGGIPQVNTVRQVLDEAGLEALPAVGLAKKEELIHLPGSRWPIRLPATSSWLTFLQQMRDEAHRFAVTYHRSLRSKAGRRSFLDEIPGIGPARRKKLLSFYRSPAGIAEASPEEVAGLLRCGPDVARQVVLAAKAHAALRR